MKRGLFTAILILIVLTLILCSCSRFTENSLKENEPEEITEPSDNPSSESKPEESTESSENNGESEQPPPIPSADSEHTSNYAIRPIQMSETGMVPLPISNLNGSPSIPAFLNC